jgi:tRNA-specific 2-thiouridylase
MKIMGTVPTGRRKRVLLGLSGGPDCAVAGALLKNQGYEIIGFHLDYGPLDKRVCRARLVRDPERVAKALEISWSKTTVEEVFEAEILDPLTHSVLQALRLPACEICHSKILIPTLLKKAQEISADAIATGHYAKLQTDHLTGEVRLARAADTERDQSYLLAGLSAGQLRNVLMPLGDLTRHLTTRLQQEFGVGELPRGTCPLRDGGDPKWAKAYTEKNASMSLFRHGIIRTRQGRVLADHTGIYQYRIGAKLELGTLSPGEEFFVLGVLPAEEAVVAGTREELAHVEFLVAQARWLRPQDELRGVKCEIWLSYGIEPVPAEVRFYANQMVGVQLKAPVLGLEPGQPVVFYREGEVIGSGVLDPMQASRWALETGG